MRLSGARKDRDLLGRTLALFVTAHQTVHKAAQTVDAGHDAGTMQQLNTALHHLNGSVSVRIPPETTAAPGCVDVGVLDVHHVHQTKMGMGTSDSTHLQPTPRQLWCS